ncbi:HesA/MoeB/ThiF family protein [Alteromonas portus]|uniref:HesA/MoeB/ThiF family protein n=1 Tax=Alteromonas portus TaxID=2565549 RepID=A0A4U0ZFF3_9ALTE|nr:HesA/MoeB/ThiF family protein [Alteromonas portus]TKB02083.1 HesA/MoeB/ThiF family protein [Alteromonas portus]
MPSHSVSDSANSPVNSQLEHQDIRRYSRQLLLDCIDHDGQLNLANAHAVVVGLGGLGSLTARYLAGAGVGNITLVDGDTVDISNLQRQISYNEMHLGELKAKSLHNELRKVNSHLNIRFRCLFADSDNLPTLISSATCVLDCTDNIFVRRQVNVATFRASIPLFIAAASGLTWQALNLPQNSATCGCYECLVNSIAVREDCLSKGILGPVVGMAACHQATQALLFMAKGFDADIKWGHYVNAHAGLATLQSFKLPPSSSCEVCQ